MEPGWVGEVLEFWFQELEAADWFAKNESVDARIHQRFLQRHAEVLASDGRGISGPRPSLAAVIGLDQFSRHLFRNRPQAYAADPQRLFLYLPFEHSEDPQDQALAVTLIGQLGDDVLGRVSTEAELALLKDPMGSF